MAYSRNDLAQSDVHKLLGFVLYRFPIKLPHYFFFFDLDFPRRAASAPIPSHPIPTHSSSPFTGLKSMRPARTLKSLVRPGCTVHTNYLQQSLQNPAPLLSPSPENRKLSKVCTEPLPLSSLPSLPTPRLLRFDSSTFQRWCCSSEGAMSEFVHSSDPSVISVDTDQMVRLTLPHPPSPILAC